MEERSHEGDLKRQVESREIKPYILVKQSRANIKKLSKLHACGESRCLCSYRAGVMPYQPQPLKCEITLHDKGLLMLKKTDRCMLSEAEEELAKFALSHPGD